MNEVLLENKEGSWLKERDQLNNKKYLAPINKNDIAAISYKKKCQGLVTHI